MKALVTGGKGFIGTHLIACLLDSGYEVVALDIVSGDETFNIPYYTCDIRDHSLSNIFQAERPDVIFHLAAQSSVPLSMTNPLEDAGTNVSGTVHLLENAVRYKSKKIIFASSAAVYGIPKALPITEKHPLDPVSFYGLSKQIGEAYINMYAKTSQLEYAILRFANVYGAGQSKIGGVITKILHSALEKKPLHIYGNGFQTRDFIYVKDIVAACEKAVHSPDGIYNISNGSELSINNLIDQVRAISSNPLTVYYTAERTGDIVRSVLDNSKAKTKFLWQPDYDMQKGLEQMLETMEQTIYKGV